MFPIIFEKISRVDRPAEVCHISVPFAQGSAFDMGQFVLLNSDGKRLDKALIQRKVLSQWQDGSVKWLSVYFIANLKGNASSRYYGDVLDEIEADRTREMVPSSGSINVSCNDYGLLVNQTANAFDYICTTNAVIGNNKSEAKFFGASITQVLVGAVRNQWSVAGEYGALNGGLPVELKWTIDRDSEWVQIDHRIINVHDVDLDISDLSINIQPDMKNSNSQTMPKMAMATSNYKTNIRISEDGSPLSYLIDGQHLMKEANEHYPETMYGTAFVDWTDGQSGNGICATLHQAYQNFPKEIQVDPRGLSLKLVPNMDEPLVLKAGMAKTHTFFLHLHGNGEKMPGFQAPEQGGEKMPGAGASEYNEILEILNHRSLQFQMPDQGILPMEIYKEAGVFEDIYTDGSLADAEFDQKMVNMADNRSRGFGILNWGDAPDMGYTNQGRGNGKLVWTNNEYDFPHAAMLLFTKTGLRRILDYVLVTARHQMDIDVCHAPGMGLRYKGQVEHSADHTTGDVKPCHQWVEGLLDYYHLTGDRLALETALGLGENIMKLLEQPRYAHSGGISARETGWAMRSLLGLYRETYDEKYLKPINIIIDQFGEWRNTYGGWLAPYTDHTVIRVPFMIAVAVGSLMRYYRIFPEDKVKALILDAVNDLYDNCRLPNGTFYYKELPSLQRPSYNCLVVEALAYAYELTGDDKFIEAGLKTYDVGGQKGSASFGKHLYDPYTLVTGGQGPKNFAQSFHALAVFHKMKESLQN